MSVNEEMERFQDVIRQLRSPKGCPWDREQTHTSLKPYLLEETYEGLEAIDSGEPFRLREELGDILLQVVMHCEIAREAGEFTLEDVIRGISAKMVRRHPHVFGETKVSSIREVWENWDKIKRAEKDKPKLDSILDSVPKTLPALSRADKVQKRAARVGFDWKTVSGAWDKIREELSEIEELMTGDQCRSGEGLTEELGDLLFSVVNVTRKLGIDAEEALRLSTAKFMQRFAYIEQQVRLQGKELKDLSLEELDALWEEGKRKLHA